MSPKRSWPGCWPKPVPTRSVAGVSPSSAPDATDVWYLYIIRCRDGSLYTGIATDVARRLAAHRAGKGAKYLRGRSPLTLVYKATIGPKSLALKVERRVKALPKARKERLVAKQMAIATLLPEKQ
ncbi:MAG: GIY-YIG nuclease family protein [Desulfobacterales bacterium]|nr:GIY-YIG nuclease family protein [Desulfobacterales bacterium]